MLHKNVTASDNHIIQAYSYANAAARTGATGFVAADLGKIAWQTDDNTFWVLIATTPTWKELTNPAVAASADAEMVWGAGNIASGADVRRLLMGFFDGLIPTTSPRGHRATRAGTYSHLHARHNTNSGNGASVVYALFVNGVVTALAVTLATGAVGGASNVANSVTIAEGDLIEMVATKALAIGSGSLDVYVSARFAA